MPRHWLMKSEPGTYSITDLERDGSTAWEGVRNYGARNNMRKMKKGDPVLFYHSSTQPPGVAGIARVSREAYPDPHQFDESSPYYDEKSDPDDPRWSLVEIAFVEAFDEPVALERIKATPELSDMVLVKRSRLSVQPVEEDAFERIVGMGRGKG